jgi:hypothetical protein
MRVWMCGTEYGGGEGGERRWLYNNGLAGTLPATLSFPNLPNLIQLCVRPAPPPHFAMWGQLPTRWGGEQVHGCCGLTPEEGELLVS